MIDSSIQSLKARYRESGIDKRAVLDTLLERYRSADVLQAGINDELKDFLHKLAGSSGMYGFERLHEAARTALTYFEGGENTEPQTGLAESIIRSLEAVIYELDALNNT